MPVWSRLAPYAWWVVICLALALACWFAGRATVQAIRQDERLKVLAEGDRLAALTNDAHRVTLARVRDSLRLALADVDTVLVRRLTVVHDTSWLPADTAAPVRLAACRVQLDSLAQSCASFRETATIALAKADTIQRRDSAAIAGLSLRLATIRRADSLKAVSIASRSRWRSLEQGVCAGSVAFNVFTLIRKP